MSSTDIRRILVAYDIPEDRRRNRLAKVVESYGDRVQYSVFVIDAAPVRIARLRRAVERVVDVRQDSILLCDLVPTHGVELHRFQYVGRQRLITRPESFVL